MLYPSQSGVIRGGSQVTAEFCGILRSALGEIRSTSAAVIGIS